MRILIIIMLLCTTLVPNYLYAISHENYSEESFLFVGEDYMQENYKVTLHLSGVSVSTLFNEIQKQTKLDFVYNTELLETITPISVTAEKAAKLSAKNLELIEEIADRTAFIKEHVDAMIEARKVANKIESEREKAIAYHDTIVPALEEIRYHIDKLELIVDNQMWTLPKYRELLFVR